VTRSWGRFWHEPQFAIDVLDLWVDINTTFDANYGKSKPCRTNPSPSIPLLQDSKAIFKLNNAQFCAFYVDLLTRPVSVKFRNRNRWDRLEAYPTECSEVRMVRLIEAWNKEGKRNRKPNKERRIVRVISAVVISSTIISAAPIASALSSVSVVSVTAVTIAAVITPVVIAVPASMNGGTTGMGGTGLRRSNSEEGDKDKTQRCYGFHVNLS
jgi:hypothetical protein